MLKFELSTEVTANLTKLGFRLVETERGESLLYEAGSIANWKRVKLTPAYEHCSLAHGEEYRPCVYAVVEREQQPGYAEVDWTYKKEGYVVVEDLFKFLENEGISLKSYEERKAAFKKKYYERKNLRTKLEEAGFDYDEIKRILG